MSAPSPEHGADRSIVSAMGVMLGIARCAALLGLGVVGLLYLNDAFVSAWVAGGPPGPHKLGWERRSLASLLWSLAAFVAAVGLFRALGRLPRIGTLAWLLLAVAAVLALAPFVAREILIDACVDRGGRWVHTALECEH